jgi:hypothetical protein
MMLYLIIHLFREEYQEEVLLALMSAGIARATVTDGVNLENVVTMDMPIFAGFRADPGRDKRFCKIISAAVESEKAVDDFLSALKMGGIDFVKDDLGVIILLPARTILRGGSAT